MFIMTEEMNYFENESLADNAKKYLSHLEIRLKNNFDLFYNKKIKDFTFDLYGYHKNVFSKSFITKATVYETFSVFEHLLCTYETDCSIESLNFFQNKLKEITPEIANPDKYHKQSTIVGILICENTVPSQIKKNVEKFAYHKNYKWSFHGWSETICVVVSLAEQCVYIPKGYKNLKKLFAFEYK